MLFDNPIVIRGESLATAGVGTRVRYTPEGTAPTSLSAVARTQCNTIIPADTQNFNDLRVNLKMINSTAATQFLYLHSGCLSLIERVRLSQVKGNIELYVCNTVSSLSKLRNMIYYSYDEINRMSPSVLVAGASAGPAAPTSSALDNAGMVGSLLHTGYGSSTTGATTAFASLQSGLIDHAGTGLRFVGKQTNVVRVITAFNDILTGLIHGIHLNLDLHQCGGFFSTNKFLPYPHDMRLELTFAPESFFAFNSTSVSNATGAGAKAGVFALSDIYVDVCRANPAVSAQMYDLLSKGDIELPVSYIWEMQRTVQSGQPSVDCSFSLNSGYGQRLRSVFTGFFHATELYGQALNTDNTSAVKWDTLRSKRNGVDLEPNDIDYKDMANYFKEDLIKNGAYTSTLEWIYCPVHVVNFCKPYALSDKSITNMDIGEPLGDRDQPFVLNVKRQTGVAQDLICRMYADCQRTLRISANLGAHYA